MPRAALAVPIALAAPALLALTACSTPDAALTSCGNTTLADPLLILERGDQSAALARLAGGCLTETGPDPVLGTDQNLLAAHARSFVGVNDDGTLRAVDPVTLLLTQTLSVYPDDPPAPSQPPHGIYGVDVDAAGNLWVSRDDLPELAILAPDGSLVAKVDLGTLDPDEHHPDMNGILIEGDRAFVALGFLTHGGGGGIMNDTARRPGMIAIIDTTSHAIVGHIDLVGHNPVHRLVPTDATGQRFIVATPGRHDSIDPDDGIDLVDLVAGTATQLISETALGGSVDNVVWASPTEAYAITLGPKAGINPTQVIAFDPQRNAVTRTLAKAPWFSDPQQGQGYVHVGLAIDGGDVVVGDHELDDPRLLVFSRANGAALPPIPTNVEAPWGLLVLAR